VLNPFDEASFLALPPDLQDFVAHLHASEGKDLDGAAGLLGVSVEAAREVLARKDVAAAIEDLSIRVAGAKPATHPRDPRSGWQKERDAKFARPGATDGQRAWNEKGGRPPSLDPAKFRDALLAGHTLGEAAATAGSRAATKKDLGTIGSQYLSQRPELRAELLAAGWDPKAAWRRRMVASAASRAGGAPPHASAPKAGSDRRATPPVPPEPPAAPTARKRVDLTMPIEVSLHPRAVEVLDRALATGLFGRSRSEAAERLLCLALVDGLPRWRRSEVTP